MVMLIFTGDALVQSCWRPGPVYGAEQADRGHGGVSGRGSVLPCVSGRVLPGTAGHTSRGIPGATQDKGTD